MQQNMAENGKKDYNYKPLDHGKKFLPYTRERRNLFSTYEPEYEAQMRAS